MLKFIKNWTLPIAMLIGTLAYLLFAKWAARMNNPMQATTAKEPRMRNRHPFFPLFFFFPARLFSS